MPERRIRMWMMAAICCLGMTVAVWGGDMPKGLWLTARKDARNQARADVAGRMTSAPGEVWRMGTGGDICYARHVRIDGRDAALVQAGSTLQAIRWDGKPIWSNLKPGIQAVLRVDDFDGDGRQEILVRTDTRTVTLLELASGKPLWCWQTELNTSINGYAIQRISTGLRWYCFPSYSVDGFCFDFSGSNTAPKLLWHQRYDGLYAAGFGPNAVLADMDGDGRQELVLSGKLPPRVAHLILDPDTGAVRADIRYTIEGSTDEGSGRPYGLLQAVDLDGDNRRDILMLSCQVEEYLAAAGNTGNGQLVKRWGRFIEKDFPTDIRELRPQITSLADIRGNGKPLLVVGMWDNGAWNTVLFDPAQGVTTACGTLPGQYFWGCYDLNGDGTPEIITSREGQRRTARVTTLTAFDGRTFQPMAVLDDAAIFTSSDSELPADRAFMAMRSNPVEVTAKDGRRGILVRRYDGTKESGVYHWGARAGEPVSALRMAGSGFTRIDLHDGRLLLSDAGRGVQRFDDNLQPVGARLKVNGRLCAPLVSLAGARRELIVDTAGGILVGGTPRVGQPGKLDRRWAVPGVMPAAHIDAAGQTRLAVADRANPDAPAVMLYRMPMSARSVPTRIPLPFPPYLGLLPYGGEYTLLVNLQTGVHTMALASYDGDGRLRWQETAHGAHPRIPGAADLNGDGQCEVIADDHGELRIYAANGEQTGINVNWLCAYSLPISGPFGSDGRVAVLRTGGLNGITLNDGSGTALWSVMHNELERWFHALAAVGCTVGGNRFAVGIVSQNGLFECLDAQDGHTRWQLDLGCCPRESSVVAGDLDGDGADEFLVGLPDGRLLCLKEQLGSGRIMWEKRFDAEVNNPIIADVDGDGWAEIILSTADGFVRILK